MGLLITPSNLSSENSSLSLGLRIWQELEQLYLEWLLADNQIVLLQDLCLCRFVRLESVLHGVTPGLHDKVAMEAIITLHSRGCMP